MPVQNFKSATFFALCVSLLVLSSFNHPFYLSVTELRYNEEQMRAQGFVKVFTNDLEDALKKLGERPVDLLNNKDTAMVTKTLRQYLAKRLSMQFDNKSIGYQVIGYENEEESTWIYIESNTCSSPKTIKIQNRILYDFLPRQMNIVHFEAAGRRESSRVTNPESELVIKI
jgi:hypothetical protein